MIDGAARCPNFCESNIVLLNIYLKSVTNPMNCNGLHLIQINNKMNGCATVHTAPEYQKA